MPNFPQDSKHQQHTRTRFRSLQFAGQGESPRVAGDSKATPSPSWAAGQPSPRDANWVVAHHDPALGLAVLIRADAWNKLSRDLQDSAQLFGEKVLAWVKVESAATVKVAQPTEPAQAPCAAAKFRTVFARDATLPIQFDGALWDRLVLGRDSPEKKLLDSLHKALEKHFGIKKIVALDKALRAARKDAERERQASNGKSSLEMRDSWSRNTRWPQAAAEPDREQQASSDSLRSNPLGQGLSQAMGDAKYSVTPEEQAAPDRQGSAPGSRLGHDQDLLLGAEFAIATTTSPEAKSSKSQRPRTPTEDSSVVRFHYSQARGLTPTQALGGDDVRLVSAAASPPES